MSIVGRIGGLHLVVQAQIHVDYHEVLVDGAHKEEAQDRVLQLQKRFRTLKKILQEKSIDF